MRAFALGAAVIVGLVAMPAAFAADLITDDVVIDEMTSSHWDGPYLGAGGIVYSSTTDGDTGYGVLGLVGVNKLVGDNFLIGAEAYLGYETNSIGPSFFALGAEGRAGVVVVDNLVLYGALGAEVDFGPATNQYAYFGGGLELAATENVSIDLEYKYFVGLNNSWQGHELGATLNWHF